MAMNLLTPANMKIKILKSERLVCLDKTHMHNSPIQIMVKMEINEHIVQITQDGEFFNIKIDGRKIGTDLTFEQLSQFIQRHT